jgi:hypothetical protein
MQVISPLQSIGLRSTGLIWGGIKQERVSIGNMRLPVMSLQSLRKTEEVITKISSNHWFRKIILPFFQFWHRI